MDNHFVDKYGVRWSDEPQPHDVEFHQIRLGKKHIEKCGRSLFYHYKECFKIFWPKDDNHRWSDLILKTYCENDISVFMGCSDSGKTYTMSKIVLVDYWCFPDKTLWLVSTTEGRGSELRIWGCIKDLFNIAQSGGHNLQGNPIDYLKTITTDVVDEEGEMARSLRRGIIVVPCKTGGVMSGLAPYIGIKSPRLRHCGDEIPAMTDAFLNAYANWFGKPDFKGMMSGNFMETDDPLGVASEPVDGWDSFVDSGKTQEWKSRFYDAHVVALDGRDSPNFDFDTEEPKYSYLISRKKLEGVARAKGTDSWEWYSQCIGKPAKGMDIWRVISKSFCEKNKAFESVVWDGVITKLYALDPAYGNGDRCVGRELAFGKSVGGEILLSVGKPEIVPIKLNTGMDAEEQIAAFVKHRLDELSIPYSNCFYDSFGRGTLGFQFSKIMGKVCPVPIDSGAKPTLRPVRFDLFIANQDGSKRLKRCDEHYTKFISEMWFSVRETIETAQIRNLDKETVIEGQSRKFTKNSHGKIEVEPKEEMKKRLGRSPDLFDCLAVGVEGARRLGFKIEKLSAVVEKKLPPDWLSKTTKEYEDLRRSRQLQQG